MSDPRCCICTFEHFSRGHALAIVKLHRLRAHRSLQHAYGIRVLLRGGLVQRGVAVRILHVCGRTRAKQLRDHGRVAGERRAHERRRTARGAREH